MRSSTAKNTNAGTATVTVKPVDGSNYTFTQFTHEFQITKVKIQIVGADFIVAPLYEEEFDGTTTGGDPFRTLPMTETSTA